MTKLEKLLEAIGKLTLGDPVQFTNGGKPKAPVLAELIEDEVSAAERDEAWAEFLKENHEAEAAAVPSKDPAPAAEKPAAKESEVITIEDVLRLQKAKA